MNPFLCIVYILITLLLDLVTLYFGYNITQFDDHNNDFTYYYVGACYLALNLIYYVVSLICINSFIKSDPDNRRFVELVVYIFGFAILIADIVMSCWLKLRINEVFKDIKDNTIQHIFTVIDAGLFIMRCILLIVFCVIQGKQMNRGVAIPYFTLIQHYPH